MIGIAVGPQAPTGGINLLPAMPATVAKPTAHAKPSTNP